MNTTATDRKEKALVCTFDAERRHVQRPNYSERNAELGKGMDSGVGLI